MITKLLVLHEEVKMAVPVGNNVKRILILSVLLCKVQNYSDGLEYYENLVILAYKAELIV